MLLLIPLLIPLSLEKSEMVGKSRLEKSDSVLFDDDAELRFLC